MQDPEQGQGSEEEPEQDKPPDAEASDPIPTDPVPSSALESVSDDEGKAKSHIFESM